MPTPIVPLEISAAQDEEARRAQEEAAALQAIQDQYMGAQRQTMDQARQMSQEGYRPSMTEAFATALASALPGLISGMTGGSKFVTGGALEGGGKGGAEYYKYKKEDNAQQVKDLLTIGGQQSEDARGARMDTVEARRAAREAKGDKTKTAAQFALEKQRSDASAAQAAADRAAHAAESAADRTSREKIETERQKRWLQDTDPRVSKVFALRNAADQADIAGDSQQANILRSQAVELSRQIRSEEAIDKVAGKAKLEGDKRAFDKPQPEEIDAALSNIPNATPDDKTFISGAKNSRELTTRVNSTRAGKMATAQIFGDMQKTLPDAPVKEMRDAVKMKAILKPMSASVMRLQELVGDDPQAAYTYDELMRRVPTSEIKTITDNLNNDAMNIVYTLSGKQVTEQEMKRLTDFFTGASALSVGDLLNRIKKYEERADSQAVATLEFIRAQPQYAAQVPGMEQALSKLGIASATTNPPAQPPSSPESVPPKPDVLKDREGYVQWQMKYGNLGGKAQ